MQQLGQYVVTLTAAGLICGIVLSVFRDGTVGSMLRLVCGVFLTVTALSPVADLSLPDLPAFASDYLVQGRAAATLGEDQAKTEIRERITQQLEAYILDKASGMGAGIRVMISVSEDGYPESVRLWGEADESVRQKLYEMITNDLGIPKENQQWIG